MEVDRLTTFPVGTCFSVGLRPGHGRFIGFSGSIQYKPVVRLPPWLSARCCDRHVHLQCWLSVPRYVTRPTKQAVSSLLATSSANWLYPHEGVDTIARHTITKERQPRAVSELSYHQPSVVPARSCSELSSTDLRPRLRKCWQKSKQVLDQAGAQ